MTQLLNPIKNVIGWLLNFFYALPPHNLGVAILLMTGLVMAVMLPLTAKQVRSMVSMQKLQPEIKRIQQQYKDDKQAQSQAIMAFYKENQINPLSGCLPLLVQFPVWIALYDTLRDLPSHIGGAGHQLYDAMCKAPLPNPKKPCGAHNLHPQKFLGMNLQLSLFNAHKAGATFVHLLPYGLLVGFVVITGIYQTRQTMARQKRQNPDQPINPQMQSMMRIMPVMNLITILFPAGVAMYWGARNVWMIGQQHLVLNKIYETHGAAVNVKATDVTTKPVTKQLNAEPDATAEPSPSNGTNGSQGTARNGSGNGAAKSGAGKGATAAARARANPNTAKKKQQRRKR